MKPLREHRRKELPEWSLGEDSDLRFIGKVYWMCSSREIRTWRRRTSQLPAGGNLQGLGSADRKAMWCTQCPGCAGGFLHTLASRFSHFKKCWPVPEQNDSWWSDPTIRESKSSDFVIRIPPSLQESLKMFPHVSWEGPGRCLPCVY